MKLEHRFTDLQLETIIDEATVYLCACPAQVAEQIRQLRHLIRYQSDCVQQQDGDPRVHQSILEVSLQAHAMMEACIDEVLDLEGWDRVTLKMPEGLRIRRDELLSKDD
jgi:hypothetical protein